jgi:hypothetical protein
MRISQIVVLAAVIGFLACGQVGCATAKVPGEEKSSVFNGTQTIVNSDPITVTNAAKTTAEELQLTVLQSGASGLDGKVVAKSSKNTKVSIDVKSAGENLSRVTVKAGGFGDKEIQKQILDRIRAKLPAPPVAMPTQNVAQTRSTPATGGRPTPQANTGGGAPLPF